MQFTKLCDERILYSFFYIHSFNSSTNNKFLYFKLHSINTFLKSPAISARNYRYQSHSKHYYQAGQTMTGRIAISFPDVDANKSPNNPNKPVHFIIKRPFLIPPACRSPHCPEWNRAFIVLGILGASFTRRGYIARAELGTSDRAVRSRIRTLEFLWNVERAGSDTFASCTSARSFK